MAELYYLRENKMQQLLTDENPGHLDLYKM